MRKNKTHRCQKPYCSPRFFPRCATGKLTQPDIAIGNRCSHVHSTDAKKSALFVARDNVVLDLLVHSEGAVCQDLCRAEFAEQWLAWVDSGDFERSWKEAAESFKAAVTLEQWQRAMASVRQPLGNVLSRTLADARYTHELPRAPDGEYVVIRYNTSFRPKKSAVETITPKLENGRWRVSGYFVK